VVWTDANLTLLFAPTSADSIYNTSLAVAPPSIVVSFAALNAPYSLLCLIAFLSVVSYKIL
jgi:hypothetical protein